MVEAVVGGLVREWIADRSIPQFFGIMADSFPGMRIPVKESHQSRHPPFLKKMTARPIPVSLLTQAGKTALVATAFLCTPLAGAKPKGEWYKDMEIGPAWSNTFGDYLKDEKRTAALKGVLLDLGGDYKALFDTETLRLVTSYKGGIEWGGTPWTGKHGTLISLPDKKPVFNTVSGPGWADGSGSLDDKRTIPGYGNLKHGSYKGYFRNGRTIVFEYVINGTPVLETIGQSDGVVTRSLKIGKRSADLVVLVADEDSVAADVAGGSAKSAGGLSVVTTGGLKLRATNGRLVGELPKGGEVTVQIAMARGASAKAGPVPDFASLIKGGAPLYPEILETSGSVSKDKDSAYVTDQITLPDNNPWKANLRFGGFDFIDEDSAALSSWNGDVWVVRGLKGDWSKLKWQRIASGLFETLGLKVVNGAIYVNGRDQITQLIDLNGDGETDYFKVFNRDVIITANFHEFAFDLQTDKEGNFYFAKASPVRGGGRGFDKILPNNGIVAKISKDGSKFEVIATGLRAPGGLSVGPNGEITTGENEGTWQPRCKINFARASQLPVFWGTEPSRGALKDAKFTEPLCYLPMEADNSGGSQVWVPKSAKFGLGEGELIHLSYGQSSVYRVLPVNKQGTLQGGVTKLPITLQSSAMRARFATDGSLYVLGFRGWQTNAATECAFQRVRYNGQPLPVPAKLDYTPKGVKITFTRKLDAELAADPTSYKVERWNYVRGPMYGSGEFSVDTPDPEAEKAAIDKESKDIRKHDAASVESATLAADGKTVELVIAGMKPSHQLQVSFDLEDTGGEVLKGDIYATVHKD